jgi:alpha-glucosidase (family GH31 glycosyl hydrolase)
MMSFKIKSKDIYGLPERKLFSRLGNTDQMANPYRLYSIDKFPHSVFDPIGLYSGIPYITGHSKTHDESIMWLTASETWVDMTDYKNEKLVNFISDAGVMEFFLFGNQMSGPKKQVKTLT